jgi:hypothetical protein
MTDAAFTEILNTLRTEFPWADVLVRPHRNEDDPAIGHFVYILRTPRARLREVSLRAWEIALDHYEGKPVPFHLSAVSEERTAQYFAAPRSLAERLASQSGGGSMLGRSLVSQVITYLVPGLEQIVLATACQSERLEYSETTIAVSNLKQLLGASAVVTYGSVPLLAPKPGSRYIRTYVFEGGDSFIDSDERLTLLNVDLAA